MPANDSQGVGNSVCPKAEKKCPCSNSRTGRDDALRSPSDLAACLSVPIERGSFEVAAGPCPFSGLSGSYVVFMLKREEIGWLSRRSLPAPGTFDSGVLVTAALKRLLRTCNLRRTLPFETLKSTWNQYVTQEDSTSRDSAVPVPT
ncbi:hypothetical protein BgiMline_018793 [Biomphalaria glabrata]